MQPEAYYLPDFQMEILTKYYGNLVKQAKGILKQVANVEILNKEQTIEYLRDYLVTDAFSSTIKLPEILDASDRSKVLFRELEAISSRNYVWQYEGTAQKNSLLGIGSISVDHKVLKTDFGYGMLSYANFGGRKVLTDLF